MEVVPVPSVGNVRGFGPRMRRSRRRLGRRFVLASAGAAAYEARDTAAFMNACISLEEAIAREVVALRTQMESQQINKDQMIAALGEVLGEAIALWPATADEDWMRTVETSQPALWARYEQAKIAGAKAAAGGSR